MDFKDCKVGMRVKRTYMANPNIENVPKIGDIGTIQVIYETNPIGVKWDGFTKGHCNDIDGNLGSQKDGWFISSCRITPV